MMKELQVMSEQDTGWSFYENYQRAGAFKSCTTNLGLLVIVVFAIEA